MLDLDSRGQRLAQAVGGTKFTGRREPEAGEIWGSQPMGYEKLGNALNHLRVGLHEIG